MKYGHSALARLLDHCLGFLGKKDFTQRNGYTRAHQSHPNAYCMKAETKGVKDWQHFRESSLGLMTK